MREIAFRVYGRMLVRESKGRMENEGGTLDVQVVELLSLERNCDEVQTYSCR